ncbi:MAG: U32 family peptidase, partial [Bdellovibrionaceae bacterium]|nr:U32 family peptidase [Pseudobdellovibrionaceae bacterium]
VLAIELLSDLNIMRFVLGRENSLSEIKLIKKSTEKELEVFVHGALCVSYSGQCFTSESIGGRSANRGQCAQSCRFSYDLIVDGEKKNTVDRDYLVSPQDLCGIAEIPELMEIGVNSFKVEGRLKSPEYVASVASSYKDVMNKTLDNKKYTDTEMNQFKHKMAVNYSRGFFPGWLNGVDHQQLVNGTFSSHRGSHIGSIVEVLPHAVVIKTEIEINLQNGDGLLFALVNSHGKNKSDVEKGSFIFSVSKKSNKIYHLGLDNNLRLDSSYMNAEVYLNHDKEQKKEIQKSYNDKNYFKRVPVSYEVTVEMGQPLKVTLTDGKHQIFVQSETKIDLAKTKGVTEEIISDELKALSGTIFSLKDIKFNWVTQDPAFISNKEVKQLRQKATEQLAKLRTHTRVDGWETALDVNYQLKTLPPTKAATIQKTKLVILLREKPQVASLVDAIMSQQISVQSLDSVILDFEFGRDYMDSIELLKKNKVKVGIATTRILKPQEYQNLRNIKNMDPDFVLARNLGAVHYFKNVHPLNKEIRGDFSLNITNHFSADYLLNKGLSTACVSYDLNSDQLNLLLQNSDAQKLEVTVHQAMPSFHMEHCVFAAFLSKGSSFKDCGKPCEKHKVQLKDQFGNHHWIKPDHECRNTMYNAKSQTALPYLSQWQKHHIGFIRYEALYEQGAELIQKISAYLNVLDGQTTTDQASQMLETVESYGLSSGNLSKQQEYQSRKKSFDGPKL